MGKKNSKLSSSQGSTVEPSTFSDFQQFKIFIFIFYFFNENFLISKMIDPWKSEKSTKQIEKPIEDTSQPEKARLATGPSSAKSPSTFRWKLN